MASRYERRLTYMRSVATSSIVGYILGLGDRHVSNILIDCQTAEMVHIDFGIAFDQVIGLNARSHTLLRSRVHTYS